MTEVEGRIEAIIRASPQLVEIEEVPLPFIVMGADNEHTGAGPCPHDIIDKTSGCGLQRLGEGVDRFLYRYKWGAGRVQEIDRHDIRELIARSEEHTSEHQSLMRITYVVFCLQQKTTMQYNTKY